MTQQNVVIFFEYEKPSINRAQYYIVPKKNYFFWVFVIPPKKEKLVSPLVSLGHFIKHKNLDLISEDCGTLDCQFNKNNNSKSHTWNLSTRFQIQTFQTRKVGQIKQSLIGDFGTPIQIHCFQVVTMRCNSCNAVICDLFAKTEIESFEVGDLFVKGHVNITIWQIITSR